MPHFLGSAHSDAAGLYNLTEMSEETPYAYHSVVP